MDKNCTRRDSSQRKKSFLLLKDQHLGNEDGILDARHGTCKNNQVTHLFSKLLNTSQNVKVDIVSRDFVNDLIWELVYLTGLVVSDDFVSPQKKKLLEAGLSGG